MPSRGRTDPGSFQARHPTRDELLDDPLAVHDPEGCIAGAHELAHAVHNHLEDAVHGQDARHGADRGVERSEPFLGDRHGDGRPREVGFARDGARRLGLGGAPAGRGPVGIGGAGSGGVGHKGEGSRRRQAAAGFGARGAASAAAYSRLGAP